MNAGVHDEEWGVPVRDSRMLWETLMLEGFQAGLSWEIILRKREAFREAFAQFDPEKVALFGGRGRGAADGISGIVRSRAKIAATIHGAQIYLAMRDEGEEVRGLGVVVVKGEPTRNETGTFTAQTALSREISAVLRSAGFQVCGR
jgi:DNA-3-methyladenine glycosylase I